MSCASRTPSGSGAALLVGHRSHHARDSIGWGYTGRDIVIKMDGCYHGAHDSMKAGSVSRHSRRPVRRESRVGGGGHRTAPFNDLAAVEATLAEGNVAAVILEAVTGNMGCIAQGMGTSRLRALTRQHGAL